MNDYLELSSIRDIYIIYQNNTSLWWLKFLKKGFRHCYLLVHYKKDNVLIKLDSLSNVMLVDMKKDIKIYDYINYLSTNADIQIQKVRVGKLEEDVMPVSLFSCVSFVKRFLGVRSYSTLTPFQLYKLILDCKNIFLDK